MTFLKPLKLPTLVFIIVLINILIYFRANSFEPLDRLFAECARNSGRVSAGINLIILWILGYFGLKSIFSDKNQKELLLKLMIMFAVNHLIHFFFVTQNFEIHTMQLDVFTNLHGFIIYLSIICVPIFIYYFKTLNRIKYLIIIIHFFNVTYMIADTFYKRYKPEDPAYLHRIGILIMISALLYVLYRTFMDNYSPKINSLNKIKNR